MSIADKLTTIAENEQKVYKAGQLSVLANAESLNGSLSGSVVSANDVNSIEHNIPCQLTSDTITDFSSVNVSKYGKNLCSYIIPKGKQNGITSELNLPIGTYTVSVNVKAKLTSSAFLYIRRKREGASSFTAYAKPIAGNTYQPDTFTVEPNCEYQIYLYCEVSNYMYNTFDQLQIEVGTDATPYERYIEPTTYTANADGTVEGITSIAPNMTLLTDTNGVVINANYYKDPDIVISNLAQSVALTGGEG